MGMRGYTLTTALDAVPVVIEIGRLHFGDGIRVGMTNVSFRLSLEVSFVDFLFVDQLQRRIIQVW